MTENTQVKQNPQRGCQDTTTQILVAIIGVVGIVMGAVLGGPVVLRFLDAPPPERLLIADFRENHNPLALTSGSLCQIGIQSGSFTANYNSAFTGSQTCTLIAGNRQYEELGYLEALFHFSEISPNDPESSAFIHMQTNIAGIVLDVGCGIQHCWDCS